MKYVSGLYKFTNLYILVYNWLFCVLQIVQDTDQKHKSSLDKITKLEQNLKNEKKIVRVSNYSLFFAFTEFNLVITRYFLPFIDHAGVR